MMRDIPMWCGDQEKHKKKPNYHHDFCCSSHVAGLPQHQGKKVDGTDKLKESNEFWMQIWHDEIYGGSQGDETIAHCSRNTGHYDNEERDVCPKYFSLDLCPLEFDANGIFETEIIVTNDYTVSKHYT